MRTRVSTAKIAQPRRRRQAGISTATTLALAVLLVAVLASAALARDPVDEAGTQRPQAVVLQVNGAIGPAVSDYIAQGIEEAVTASAPAVIVQLDTPGGLDTSMRAIIRAIVSAPIPVITFVAPGGSRAASAGTYILYASHVAAMAPGTNLGAATPVPIGPGMMPAGDGKADDEQAGGDEGVAPSPEAAMQRKVLNDAIAYLRALAELRGRNAEWAEEAVREGASLSAERALELGVIDLVARDLPDLLARLDGRRVEVLGTELTLATTGWELSVKAPDWRARLLGVLTNPNVAYLLFLLGIYGLLFELYSPGAIVPGIVGAVSLVLALYALHLLPVNYAGVALILIGVALMAAELASPSFGAIGAGGVGAFVIGSVMLFDPDEEGLAVSIPLVAAISLAAAGLFAATIALALRQRGRPIVTGREEMIGSTATALGAFDATGTVHAHGEIWFARTQRPIADGQPVRIRDVDGLTVEVEPFDEED